jgi:hypothetical protein
MDKEARLLQRYRGIVSGAVLICGAWAIYHALKLFMFWMARAFELSSPDIENLAMLLSLPFLAAVWFSHAWVMARLDKID